MWQQNIGLEHGNFAVAWLDSGFDWDGNWYLSTPWNTYDLPSETWPADRKPTVGEAILFAAGRTEADRAKAAQMAGILANDFEDEQVNLRSW